MDILNSKWNCAICIDSRQGGREENQDCYACSDTPIGFVAVVCDGMGGGPGGANASTLAVQAILQHLNSCNPVADAEAALKNAINNANRLLRQTIAEHAELRGMGTTCVVAVVKGKVATVAHVATVAFIRCAAAEWYSVLPTILWWARWYEEANLQRKMHAVLPTQM